MIERAITGPIRTDLERKIVLVAGPRQCGKTTLSRSLYSEYQYLNYDAAADRLLINRQEWLRNTPLVIFDELHKMPQWKRWLKGIYDTQPIPPRLLVTGSDRLEISRKMGDSLAGRHFLFRLHPFTIKELQSTFPSDQSFPRLMRTGGFPEPFLADSPDFYRRWKRSHLDIIMRQDLLDLESIRNITGIETLIELLRHRVGTPVSYQSLSRELQCDATTVKRWLNVLENLYVIFRVSPWHRSVARALTKEPKYYFYDIAHAPEDPGARYENLVALELHCEAHRVEDTTGRKVVLWYLRTREGQELDFLISVDDRPRLVLEAKYAQPDPPAAMRWFHTQLAEYSPQFVHLVAELDRERDIPNGPSIRRADSWLAQLNLVE